jgi:AraC-like DNA-binding protein
MKGILIPHNPHISALYTFFQRRQTADFVFRGESHAFYELVYVNEGRAGITADHQVFELEAGQAFLHPPMQFHAIYGLNEPFTYTIITFSGTEIPATGDRVCRPSEPAAMEHLYQLGKQRLRSEPFWIKEATDPLPFVKELERFLLLLQPEDKRRKSSQSALNYAAIIRTLQQNIHRRLTVREVAELCSMSEINLQKTFARYAGVGIMDYFNRIKMQEAVRLLQAGLSVKETALQLGYTDQNYFSTAFKRIIGKTPTHYK